MADILKDLIIENNKKIVLLVLDGIGGLPLTKEGKTELETAIKPNMNKIAEQSECGLHIPIDYGIAPGSAPGHLALFGYDPLIYPIGRGVVAATGIGFPMQAGDVAVRLNFATRDETGNIIDRRAGRIATEVCSELCDYLSAKITVPNVQIFVKPVKDYRGVVIFRGKNLSDNVKDTDTQAVGAKPLDPEATSEKGKKTASIAKDFVDQALKLLKDKKPANAILLRGFAELPHIPSMNSLFKLKPLALAVYPDYKGVSRLVGMEICENLKDLNDQVKELKKNWDNYNFFFIHHKYSDSKGEDGDFPAKVSEIEKVDGIVQDIIALKPDVLIITGDHSTPAKMKAHSSHPIPFIIYAENIRPDQTKEFGERACAKGMWGILKTTMILRLALSYADKIKKYGA